MGERADVEFTSAGNTLRGWLYQAGGPAPRPAVVMAHGLSAVKEMFLDDYAAAFATAGFTTLVYDHPGFGASDGAPRQSSDPGPQLQGYRDAVTWLAAQDDVDAGRIGLWGTSFSGGHVIELAAEDLPVACAVAQVPRLESSGSPVPDGAVEAIGRALESGDLEARVPAVTATPDGEGVMYLDGAYDWFVRTAAERAPAWRNELRIDGLVASGAQVPRDSLADARVPLLLVVAPDDHLVPPGPARSVAAAAANVEVVDIPGGHFDAYQAGFGVSSSAAIDWFRRHLTG